MRDTTYGYGAFTIVPLDEDTKNAFNEWVSKFKINSDNSSIIEWQLRESIAHAKNPPERIHVDKFKKQLENLSDAVAGLDDFTKNTLIKNMLPQTCNLFTKKYTSKDQDGELRPQKTVLNGAIVEGYLLKILEAARLASIESLSKKMPDQNIKTDKAFLLIAHLEKVFQNPVSTREKMFCSLVEIGLEAIDHKTKNAERLIIESRW